MTEYELERLIERLIKDRLIQLKLVDTGALLDSIKVRIREGEIEIESLKYLDYLDGKYNILNYVYNTDEFINGFTSYVAQQMMKNLDDIL
jgi:hypothetical protein